MASCFAGYDGRGEYIGTSGPADFELSSQVVAIQTDMSFRRIMGARLGEDLPVYRVEPGGEFVPLSLADQIESEINEDLANARLVEAFNSVLLLGAEALQLYQTLDPTQKNSYYHLQSLLTWMLDYKVTLATGA